MTCNNGSDVRLILFSDYAVMQEIEDDSQKWFDLATDSEAEEAQKSYFFDNLNWYCSLKPFGNLFLSWKCKFRNFGVLNDSTAESARHQ